MDEPYISRPDVSRMIRLAVKRAKSMFAAFSDLDEESLYADMFGAVGLATYKPEKMAPHSFAYMCASARLKDISRKRSLELQHFDKSLLKNGVRLSHVYANEVLENTDAELAEKLEVFHRSTVSYLESMKIPVRPQRCAPPDADRAQRVAMMMLQKDMNWTCRQAEDYFKRYPQAGESIGVTYPPSRQFFTRAAQFCHIVKNNPSALASPSPAAPE